ncbi:hypothetical protein E4U41_005008 [Claviceps citrina]|nr:hypothetical protein E4U41_005008 [Claviceps citrina]
MQSEIWGNLAYITTNRNHVAHQRESSLSSLGSTGPASPFVKNISNPQIAIADSNTEGFIEACPQDYGSNQALDYHQFAKLASSDSHASYLSMDGSIPHISYSIGTPFPETKIRTENGAPSTSEYSRSYTTSHSASATSSTGDASQAGEAGDLEQFHRRKYGDHSIPKLGRTMTDVYDDELYSPHFVITSTSSPQPHSAASAGSDVFSQRINAANHQHLSAVQSPGSIGSRARSPFRTKSPFSSTPPRGIAPPQFPTSQRWGEQDEKSQTRTPYLESALEPETPKTISPKDAILEFNEGETDWGLSLFSQTSLNPDVDGVSKSMHAAQADATYILPNGANKRTGLEHLPSQVLTEIHVPQQYPSIAYPSGSRDSPPRLSSSGASSVASGGNTPTDCDRPTNTGADSGTYTCTYHGCTYRFDTPTMLQKHKREGHRQMQGLVSSRGHEPCFSSNMLNSQAGPHRCDRINPSTGKTCNTIFSRPYDLTRHEDTIHNARKQKVRCNLCTEEKTFSRADALTRHYRVCHPDMEFPGKSHRKRGA